MHQEEPPVTRRSFCTRLLLTATGLGLAATTSRAHPSSSRRQVAYPPRRIEGAEQLLPGSSLYFYYPQPSDPAILMRSAESEFFAFSRRCAHMACSVNFDPAAKCLQCPCHRGAYNAKTGSVIFGPPLRPLESIVLEMRAGGELWAVGIGLPCGDSN